MKTSVHPPTRRSRGAFALVTTLLILSLLAIVAVSYLSSMSAERQTAEAYGSKAVAEQAAQTAVDNAGAMLAECFRDFPDSATVWDTTQTTNSGTPYNATAVVGGTNNEGTSLYLRAVPSGTGSAAYANPLPPNVAYANNGGTSYTQSNDPNGNDPNNPACQNFVLPLISGVPNGQARLISSKSSIFSSGMNLGESDPAKQNWTDLNIRRSGSDTQGIIGSPPAWAGVGPKPARAYWVNLKGSDGLATGRYAFWIEDESFRTNVNLIGNTPPRADNASNSRSLLPSDAVLSGALLSFGSNSTAYADRMIATRDSYPGKFLPDPQAFAHSTTSGTGASGFDAATADGLRYLTTTQSGSLNLTRHGSQRLNLNATTTINATTAVTMPEIRKLVEAIRFHLPNFGQRFYRSTNPDLAPYASTRATILNKVNDVPTGSAAYAEMYLYKTAANLRDYIDTDDQPTMIVRPQGNSAQPTLAPATPPTHPFGSDGQGSDGPNNYMWAQGKDGAPFIQEAVVRYRPTIQDSGENYTLSVDYYVEVWNMSDHDVLASRLDNPFLRISNQQQWYATYIDKDLTPNAPLRPRSTSTKPDTSPRNLLTCADHGVAPGDSPTNRDFNLDLAHNVYRADSPTIPAPDGVVFKAGAATVITTDPDAILALTNASHPINSRFIYGGQQLTASGFSAPNVYYCAQTLPPNDAHARRTFSGPTGLTVNSQKLRGIMPDFRATPSSTVYYDYEVEAVLGNDKGYLDCALGPFCISAGSNDASSAGSTNGYDFTWTASGEPHNDYLHGGSLSGNSTTPSELGDPRTNNEQILVQTYNGTSFLTQPDQVRYASPAQALAPPFSLGTPNSKYVQPANSTTTGYTAWSDYYDWPGSNNPAAPPYPTTNVDAASAPAVIANSALTSIGQLGDLFDPLRVIGTRGSATFTNSRGGGRTLKIGQRDDRFTYDTTGNLPDSHGNATNTINNVPASNGWASWRLTDIFGIGDALELPGRININGVPRDKGAALCAALTGFTFQPQTGTDYLVHGDRSLVNVGLSTDPGSTTGVQRLISQITNRLALTPAAAVNVSTSGYNTPWGPFFERGELGELENDQVGAVASTTTVPFFGRSGHSTVGTPNSTASTGLTGVNFNKVTDRGREELFRRLVEMICTRGDTFTVYVVGQSLLQPTATAMPKITGTQRMRVTFRLVPKQYDTSTGAWKDFHPGYDPGATAGTIVSRDFDPEHASTSAGIQGINQRFAKPERYEVQVLSANAY